MAVRAGFTLAGILIVTILCFGGGDVPPAPPVEERTAGHWAFRSPATVEPPAVELESWPRNEIDRFILARLEKEGLAPAPETDLAGRLRRVTFDLTGLPPTLDELDEFLTDTRTDAYERAVDRLLASPRYGERMAQEWLDLARYADSHGYHHDSERQIWKWREWVIRAFNDNKPFDEFTIEQLAGDLLPNATLEHKIATGFNRNHPVNTEAGEEKDEYRSVYVIDRVNTTATVWMGLTLGCAQCHDHKYDPITQKEFYRFYALFNNVKEKDAGEMIGSSEPTLLVPDEKQKEKLEPIEKEIEGLETLLTSAHETMDSEERAWIGATLERVGEPIEWHPIEPTGLISRAGAHLKPLADGFIIAGGPNPVKDTYVLVAQLGRTKITGLRLEVLPSEHCPENASGRSKDGTFYLEELEVTLTSLSDSGEGQRVRFHKGEADFEQRSGFGRLGGFAGSGADGAVDGGRGGWGFRDGERYVPHEAVFLPTEPLRSNDASVLRISLRHQPRGVYKSTIGHFRVSYTDDERLSRRMMPVLPDSWYVVGPFPGTTAKEAFEKTFDPEKDIAGGIDLEKEYDPVVLPKKRPARGKGGPGKDGADKKNTGKGDGKPGKKADADASPGPRKKSAGRGPARGGEFGAAGEPEPGKPKKPLPPEPERKSERAEKPSTTKPKPVAKPAEVAASPTENANAASAPAAGGAQGSGRSRRQQRPKKLRWQEKPEWRDRGTQRLKGSNSAYYLYREIDVDRDREVLVRYSGPVAARFWIDGEEVHVDRKSLDRQQQDSKGEGEKAARAGDAKPADGAGPEPSTAKRQEGAGKPETAKPPATAEPAAEPQPESPFPDGMIPEGAENFGDFSFFRGRRREDPEFRIPLTAGKHIIVAKIIAGRRRGSYRFELIPEGPDVVSYELITDLRAEATATEEKPGPVPAVVTKVAERALVSTVGDRSGAVRPASSDDAEPVTTPTPDRRVDKNAKGKPRDEKAEAKRVESASDRKDESGGDAPAAEKEDPKKTTESTDPEKRRKRIREYFRRHASTEGVPLYRKLDKLKKEKKRLERSVPRTMVMNEEQPRDSFLFMRGVYNQKGEKVTPGVPAVLPQLPDGEPVNRLTLARWLVAGRHPLTARVTVNRIWQQYFGEGLVDTPDDFGLRGSRPSHPELLDWLALWFVDTGWDVKALHRKIVTSATYRQSAAMTPEARDRDDHNRLLARGPRLRLNAEMVRDNALAVSGLLVEKLGGKSIKPYQPKGLWQSIGKGRYRPSKGDDLYRRGLYVFWKRGALYPSFAAFDAPMRESCASKRVVTNTPLQALVLLNDPVYVEAARKLAERMMSEAGKNTTARLLYGFRLCTSRLPNERELAVLRRVVAEQKSFFEKDEESAKKLVTVGDSKPPEAVDPKELAVWTAIGNVLLNLDATVHRGS